ncbi:rolling circle replication-associated protein [Phytohabitans rumicis]|uniref:Replication-associated protein ORF2/G2P domain-containing protein n=1 Tax=Phytohabitans rumicis TaxID=1076125 RepID=A0A6V8L5C9_9ACTN|nr:hypothetical protein [Phytohabitans rumicis]GFJ92462.1 hypothetical protein Prum_061040 [Phytohabitans rumicis]
MLEAAAGLYEALPSWDGHEGPRARVTIGPGAVGVKRTDLARRERTAEREQRRRRKVADELAGELERTGEFPPAPMPRREITGWSRKSRANMVRALCELDYLPMFTNPAAVPAMVTLTYPGDWLTVAPNGRAVKRHLDEFYRRYRAAWGTELLSVWKLEFQRRGAPHFHMLMVPPHGRAHSRADAAGSGLPFKAWLSVVWADIVNHPDPIEHMNHLAAGTGVDYQEGARLQDPKRAAIYFTKHGSFSAKEYQNCVPDAWTAPGMGPGRFWGYRYLDRVVRGVEVSPRDAQLIARTIRRWARAQGTTREVRAPRVRGGRVIPVAHEVVGLAGAQLVASRGKVRHRRVRRRVERMRGGAGWVSVNDGAAFASQLARWLAQMQARARSTVLGLMGDRVA